MKTIKFLKINRGTVIAEMQLDYIPHIDEVVVIKERGYLVRGVHHYLDQNEIQILLDEYPYLYK